jgi:ketosteroid isomerase-like protein
MANERNEILRRIYTAVQQQDADAVRRSVAHNIEWVLPETLPWGGTHQGQLGIMAVLEMHDELIEGEWADPEEYFEADGRYVVLGRTRGKARATGVTFEVPFAHLWQMTQGPPSAFRGYFDTAPITAALKGETGGGE